MSHSTRSRFHLLALTRTVAASALAAAAASANAAPYELIYTGTFDTTESLTMASSPTPFATTTPFTIRAFFDDSTPNLLPPIPVFSGFHAYAPSLATIEMAGTVYTIDPSNNVAVSWRRIAEGTPSARRSARMSSMRLAAPAKQQTLCTTRTA